MRKKMKISIDDRNVFEATVDIKDMEKYEDLSDILQEVVNMLKPPNIMNKIKLVKFNAKRHPIEVLQIFPPDFTHDAVFALLGEIDNTCGCCVVASKKSGRVYMGYNIDNFVTLDNEEL